MAPERPAAAKPDWVDLWSEIRAKILARRRILLALSFDGILSATALKPKEAVVTAGMQDLLTKLALSPRITLAILSGRSLTDLQERLGIKGAYYVGNHGVQVRGPGFSCSDGLAVSCRSDLVDALVLLSKCAKRLRGVLIEDKGFTIATHWRMASQGERSILRELLRVITTSHPRLEILEGEACWELRARASWDKANALRQILRHLQMTAADTIYVGEGFTGTDAFNGLSEGLTFCIGLSPDTGALYHLDETSDVAQLLFRIFYTLNGPPRQ